MRTTAPSPELLADHTGKPLPVVPKPLSYEQARLGMAFHEAGHAVLAVAYGMRVGVSEVIAWTDEQGLWNVTGHTTSQARTIHPWRFAAQSAAGAIAEVQYLLAYGLWTPQIAASCEAPHDREYAIDVLAQYGYRLGRDHTPWGGKSWSTVQGMARRKIGHLWREIRTVAHAMDEHTMLTGADITALTGLVPSFERGAA
ncbi:hypothetical protein [Streptomyces sp. NPDC051665]|uniref:hypothetical protein n=1 Tax=Streptomyces sp. NPDC051665 TaxID=3154647 RepID=UPI003423D3A8